MKQNINTGDMKISFKSRLWIRFPGTLGAIVAVLFVIFSGCEKNIGKFLIDDSDLAIYDALRSALKGSGLPDGAINLIKSTDRKAVGALLELDDLVDLVMPRGGEGLIREVVKRSRIPVIKHYKGVCHVYVDEHADINMAHAIAVNAKVQRPGVCNAMETLLVHKDIAPRYIPVLFNELREKGVEIRGCRKTGQIVKDIREAKEEDIFQEEI